MGKVLFFLLVFTFSISSCTKKQEASRDTYEYFRANLKTSMTYTDIVSTFGTPDGDFGSGIHIYYYVLKDGTSVWIGYTDKILYARHMSSSDRSTAQVLHNLI